MDILSIFREQAREVYRDQNENPTKKKKYKEAYCCSDEEVDNLITNFEVLLDNKEKADLNYFTTLLTESEEGKNED